MGLDIGPKTVDTKTNMDSKMVLWNGPMGVFEMEPFAKGTMAIAKAVRMHLQWYCGWRRFSNGGEKSGLADKMSHISTGGGASLEFLEGRELPGIAILKDQ